MPATQKTPANNKKKVTAPARARVSTRKVKRTGIKKLNKSYIQSTPSDPTGDPQSDYVEPSTSSNDSSEAVLSMLTKLTESNQAIIQRIEAIEQKQQVDRQPAPQPPFGSDIRQQRLPMMVHHTTSDAIRALSDQHRAPQIN